MINTCVRIAMIAMSRTCVSKRHFHLHLFSNVNLRSAYKSLNYQRRNNIVFRHLFTSNEEFRPKGRIRFKNVRSIQVVFLFRSCHAIRNNILKLYLNLYSRERKSGRDSYRSVLCLFRGILCFLLRFLRSFIGRTYCVIINLMILLRTR